MDTQQTYLVKGRKKELLEVSALFPIVEKANGERRGAFFSAGEKVKRRGGPKRTLSYFFRHPLFSSRGKSLSHIIPLASLYCPLILSLFLFCVIRGGVGGLMVSFLIPFSFFLMRFFCVPFRNGTSLAPSCCFWEGGVMVVVG